MVSKYQIDKVRKSITELQTLLDSMSASFVPPSELKGKASRDFMESDQIVCPEHYYLLKYYDVEIRLSVRLITNSDKDVISREYFVATKNFHPKSKALSYNVEINSPKKYYCPTGYYAFGSAIDDFELGKHLFRICVNELLYGNGEIKF